MQLRVYIRPTRPSNPYKQGYIRCQALQRSLLRVNRSNWYIEKLRTTTKLITWSKRAGKQEKQGTQPQQQMKSGNLFTIYKFLEFLLVSWVQSSAARQSGHFKQMVKDTYRSYFRNFLINSKQPKPPRLGIQHTLHGI